MDNIAVNDTEHVLTFIGSDFEQTPAARVGAEPLVDVGYISTLDADTRRPPAAYTFDLVKLAEVPVQESLGA